jgi:hypothetical protein
MIKKADGIYSAFYAFMDRSIIQLDWQGMHAPPAVEENWDV